MGGLMNDELEITFHLVLVANS